MAGENPLSTSCTGEGKILILKSKACWIVIVGVIGQGGLRGFSAIHIVSQTLNLQSGPGHFTSRPLKRGAISQGHEHPMTICCHCFKTPSSVAVVNNRAFFPARRPLKHWHRVFLSPGEHRELSVGAIQKLRMWAACIDPADCILRLETRTDKECRASGGAKESTLTCRRLSWMRLQTRME